MKKFFKIIFVLVISITIFSCSKDDNSSTTKKRDYDVQYASDLDSIDKFIDTHSMTVDADFNVIYAEVEDSQLSIRNQYTVESKTVYIEAHDVDYKVYYIKLREGNGQAPSSVDSVHVSYKGVKTLDNTQFDYAEQPVWFKLDELVSGWSEIIPFFKTGTYDGASSPNPVNFDGFGAGVMFLPSGLAYYNTATGTLSAYSTLVFSFKLYELRYRDHDRDKILSKDEIPFDIDPLKNDPRDYDTDGDEIPNYFDPDDDDDRVLTKNELKKPDGTYHTFLTVPGCDGLATDPNRLRRYIDPSCKPPFTN